MGAPRHRLAIYTDYAYHRHDGAIYAERAFGLFLSRLAEQLGGVVLIGRLDPEPAKARYALGRRIDFVALPYYRSLAEPLRASRGMLGSLRRFWRALDAVDGVWLLGPHPLAIAFASMAVIRRRRVFLGVRQDLPAYVRSRRPGRPLIGVAAKLLEVGFRLLSRRCATVVVGPQLAHNYRHARRLLEITVSLVDQEQIARLEPGVERPYEGDLRVLSVGRIDAEKNPLLLADVLSRLRGSEPRWRLVVCGEGSMEPDLRRRLEELGIAGSAELRGYVPLDEGLVDLYRTSHALLHVSWTEGLPQILFEAFAARLPVVATDVGGIREAVGDAVALVPAGDAEAAAEALHRIAADPEHRRLLVDRGLASVREHTLDAEVQRTATFLAGS